jgi:inhibitor of KinA sporulation pathway (predicted exonuclease)
MEIIEIGAVLVAESTLAPLAEYQSFVRPIRHPVLTPFCTRLTSIAQEDVIAAPSFPTAVSGLGAFLREHAPASRPVFCSWGQYDKNQFEQDAAYHRVKLPFGTAHVNLKKRFADQFRETKKLGMHEALERVGLSLVGVHHRGIDDARNIARLLPWVLGRAALGAGSD